MMFVNLIPKRRGASIWGRLIMVSALALLVGCGKPSAGSIGTGSAATTTLVTASTTPTTGSGLPPSTPSSAVRPTTTVTATTAPPTTPTTPVASSGVQGSVRFGPVCPVERIPPDPLCAPRPGAAHIQLLGVNGRPAAEGDAGGDGRFSIPVGPGTYVVSAIAPTPGPGRGCEVEPAKVTVVAGSFSAVAVTCDTGIR